MSNPPKLLCGSLTHCLTSSLRTFPNHCRSADLNIYAPYTPLFLILINARQSHVSENKIQMNRSIQVSLGSRNEGDELVVRVVLITNFLDSNNGDSLADDSAKAGLTLTITYGTPILRQRKMTSSMGSTSAFLASTRAVTRLRPYFAKDEFFSCP